jgi:ClpP class serine protease
MLKQYPGHIRTIIPMYSMSGGTLLALSTDELVMSPTSCLGPVDPQLGTLFKFGSAKSWDKILKFKGKKADDSSISLAYTGKQYTKSIRDHMLKTVDFGLSPAQKKSFVNFITSGEVEHACALTPMELKGFGFKIRKINNNKFMEKMINFISKVGSEGVTYV